MSRFTQALVVSPLADGKTWVIREPFGYEVGSEGSSNVIDVDVGFMTDFASIPRVFWVVLPKWGKYGNAAVLHDWLYWSQERGRKEADQIALEAMSVLSVSKWKKYAIYWAVRAFGWIAWNRNIRDRKYGFNRVMKNDKIQAIRKSNRPGLFRSLSKHYLKIPSSHRTPNN